MKSTRPSDQHSRLRISRRRLLTSTAGLGCSLPMLLQARAHASTVPRGKAKSCILLYCWGGMSHHDTWDPKPHAPAEIRGEFRPIATATPGIQISEHLPRLAKLTEHLAIIRSIHHDDSAHGRGMYWNLTGHRPPRAGNIPPMREDWPSLPAMVSKLRKAPQGVPPAIRLPYPMVDNGTLQAGEYAGWLGPEYDPIVMRPEGGTPYGGVSRTLGSEVLDLDQVDVARLKARESLLRGLDRPWGSRREDQATRSAGRATRSAGRATRSFDQATRSFDHFQDMAQDILLGTAVRQAYDLERETPRVRESYGDHLGGRSMLLARRLTEAGVPIVQVCCAAGDLNGGAGDMWDTHGDNFNRLRDRLLPVFDRAAAALITDLTERGTLEETLVAIVTDFGRTPRINGGAGRDHYPNVYSVALAGGGIRGGQVYGSSDGLGAFPDSCPCGPPDLHATIFHALGISPRAIIHDMLDRPFTATDGEVLPLF